MQGSGSIAQADIYDEADSLMGHLFWDGMQCQREALALVR